MRSAKIITLVFGAACIAATIMMRPYCVTVDDEFCEVHYRLSAHLFSGYNWPPLQVLALVKACIVIELACVIFWQLGLPTTTFRLIGNTFLFFASVPYLACFFVGHFILDKASCSLINAYCVANSLYFVYYGCNALHVRYNANRP